MHWWYVTHASGWLVSLVLLPVLARRYAPAKAWAWLAVMLAAPWVGLILFLLFAENPLGRRRIVRYRQALEGSMAADRCARMAGRFQGAHLPDERQAVSLAAEACGALPLQEGNALGFSTRHEQTLQWLLDDIEQARNHVHLVFYIIKNDVVGGRVAEALERAAARGVTCRVVADALGSRAFLRGRAATMKAKGIHVVAALPFRPFTGRRLARLDLRNHRKIAVIDGRVAYIGSWNIVDPDFGPRGRGRYHDLMARVQGPAVLHLQLLFLEDWRLETGESLSPDEVFVTPEAAGNVVTQVLPSGPLYPFAPVRDLTVELLGLAQKRIVLTTPYFIPDEAVMLGLRLAAQRGVEVNVVVPVRSDSRLADAAGRAYLAELADAEVRVHCFTGGFLHAKSITVDDKVAMVGSANYDIRSFHLDIEANLILYTPETVKALGDVQRHYLSGSVPFTRRWGHRSWLRRVADDTAKLISPLA